MLHTLSGSANSNAFAECLRLLCADDALVLMGDGVYAALEHSSACKQLQESKAALYVLRDDAVAAGITDNLGNTPLIGMEDLVDLSEQHQRQQAWY